MSDLKRIRNEISAVQEKLRSLGNTNRNRWARFSLNPKMTRQEFEQKLHAYGFEYSNEDIDEIWGITEPENGVISLNNFIKLIQVDPFSFVPVNIQDNSTGVYNGPPPVVVSPRNAPPPEDLPPLNQYEDVPAPKGHNKVSSTSKSIFDNLHEIILQCMDLDRKKRAEVSLRSFTSICADAGVNSYNEEWKEFIHKFDPYATGLIPYFLIADTVCKDNDINEIPAPAEDLPPLYDNKPPLSPHEPYNQYDAPPPRAGAYDEVPPPQGRPAYDGYQQEPPMSPQEIEREERFEESSRYGKFEPGEEPPPIKEGALAKFIADKVDESMGSSKNAFDKWRGIDSRLTPQALQKGLHDDAHIDVPLDDLIEITSKFGGDLSEMGFSRMLEVAKPPTQRKMTQDDQALQDIADQIQQTGWEGIFFKGSSAEEVTRLLAEMGVVADQNDIRRLIMKLGRTGVIDALKQRLGQ